MGNRLSPLWPAWNARLSVRPRPGAEDFCEKYVSLEQTANIIRAMSSSYPASLWLAWSLGVTSMVRSASGSESPAGPAVSFPLTNATAVRSLPAELADHGLPVSLQGVVTFTFNPRSWFLQDQSAGIYVGNGVDAPNLSVGDVVEVEGISQPGGYAPLVQPALVRVMGHTNLPPARRVSFADLMTGREDSQWVEVVGLVRAAYGEPSGQQALEIDMGGGRVTVFVPSLAQSNLVQWVDSRVRVRGVGGTWFNKLRQLFGVRLMVPRWDEVVVEEAAAGDAWAQPGQPIGNLLRFTPQGSYGHQVKVSGTVVLQQPGRALFLQDEQHGLYVQTRQPGLLIPGDQVEVVGFPDKGEYTPMLQDASWRKTGSGPEPMPVPVRLDEALSGLQDSRLVSIDGRLLDRTHGNQDTTLVLEADGHVFSALLQSAGPGTALASLENHSLLRLTGVCRIEVGEEWRADPEWRAKSFRILLRTPADLQVLALPPWWSLRRLLWAVAILVGVVLASLLWASVLRRKVAQQTAIIRQKMELEARLKERYRDLFESANDMVYTHDLSGRITSINVAGEQILGLDRTQIVNRELPDFIAEEQRPAARRWLQDIVDGTAAPTVEWDFLTKTGQSLRLEASTRLIDHEGREVEVEGIARDVTERRRLEKEILEASSREQRRIGHDLHDGVCQQLAGIAVLSDILADKLDEERRPEAGEAHQITELVDQANQQTRSVARGLFPVRLEENGLASALEELATNATTFYQTQCEFQCERPVVIRDHSAAHHLYFIAQESILNAVKHGKARLIQVKLDPAGHHGCLLAVCDDGVGFSDQSTPGPGMGIRIMKYRARMIGAVLAIDSPPGGGTRVVCQFLPGSEPGVGRP
jgi:PAS domain S-box-containing protein